jgi:DNA polymerase-3 subunit alpha
VLAQSRQGYHHLCELLSRSWLHNAQRGQAWLQWSWLVELNEGLIVLSGAENGALGQALLSGDWARAEAVARRIDAAFPKRFYLELQRAGCRTTRRMSPRVKLANALRLPVVATHPVQFLTC